MFDCNYCKHLNLTEDEQTEKKEDHVCQFYDMRVFHNCSTPYWLTSFLYPCDQCVKDNYQNFEPRNAIDLEDAVAVCKELNRTSEELIKIADDTRKNLSISNESTISYPNGLSFGGYQVITSKLCSDRVQVRRHKKARINKKWRKRYGFKDVPWKTMMVDDKSKIILMHPDTYYALLANMKPPKEEVRYPNYGHRSFGDPSRDPRDSYYPYSPFTYIHSPKAYPDGGKPCGLVIPGFIV